MGCRHAVDVHLQRWPQALHNLLAAGDEHFSDALALAEERVRPGCCCHLRAGPRSSCCMIGVQAGLLQTSCAPLPCPWG